MNFHPDTFSSTLTSGQRAISEMPQNFISRADRMLQVDERVFMDKVEPCSLLRATATWFSLIVLQIEKLLIARCLCFAGRLDRSCESLSLRLSCQDGPMRVACRIPTCYACQA
ncbi:hypothetical protein AC1031_020863 [Aphanomyces cochlioides]|nr:hypothetical protein AC1031_020863 [Aphanomyces cochlioides]